MRGLESNQINELQLSNSTIRVKVKEGLSASELLGCITNCGHIYQIKLDFSTQQDLKEQSAFLLSLALMVAETPTYLLKHTHYILTHTIF